MQPGDVVADRFEVLALAGTGGMGRVYRARDRQNGDVVALKILHGTTPEHADRFVRECRVLRHLSHPNIVRFIESGTTADARAFLAMEWIEGEDLATKLERGPLDEGASLDVARAVAEALALAHGQAIVHRDVKPANIMIPGGNLARAKLADFGVARWQDTSVVLSHAGQVLGTPRFMAPEQVRGADDIDARADVFALGCVLYECLAGKPAFDGPEVRVVFAKILFDEAPRISWTRKDVSLEIDRLVASMLSRDTWARPTDGATVAAKLAELASAHAPTLSDDSVASVDAVQRWAYAVVASPKDARTATAVVDELRRSHGKDVELLRDGTIILVSRTKDSATDGANAAARCALALRGALPDAHVTLSANRTTVTGRSSFGDLLERALVASGPAGRIVVDEHVAALLDGRFKLAHEPEGIFLEGEDDLATKPRTLLGRPTPTVGREREVATLRATFEEAREESVARAALVTAAPGIGKSRLRHELLHGLDGFEVWSARADALVAGAPHLVAGRLVRDACGANAAESSEETRKRLRERISTRIDDPTKREHTMAFLAELVGVAPEAASREVASARAEASIMVEQIKSAWETMVEATCRARPLLIAIEDMHWGDLPSTKLLDGALRRCRELPLVVLAFARPEIERTFPGLWAERSVTHHRLSELSSRASKKLVVHVLGESVPPETVDKLVTLSTGNALYLEELIRSAALAEGSPLPPTIVALMEARLDALAPEARRLLQAGSVYGETFWLDGARAVLPPAERAGAARVLAMLVESELLERHSPSRFSNDEEVRFRHALVREAAYASVAENDRTRQHGDAARWLIAAGETDAFTLAEHFERAGRVDEALPYFLRAAREALHASDLATTQTRSRRGLDAGATGATRRELLLLQGEALAWEGQLVDAAQSFGSVLADPDHASDPASACNAIGWQSIVSAMRGLTISESDYAAPALSFLLSIDDPRSCEREFFRAAKYLVTVLYFQADPDRAEGLVSHIKASSALDPTAAGWRAGVLFMHARFRTGDTWRELQLGIEAHRHCVRGGDLHGDVHFATQTSFVDIALGCADTGLARVEPAIELAERFGISLFAAHAYGAGALCAAHVGDAARARRYMASVEKLDGVLQNEIFGRWGLLMGAMAARQIGELAVAERWCNDLLPTTKLTAVRAAVHIGLAVIVLEQGRPDEAFNHCLAAIELTRRVKLRGTFDLDLFDAGVRALRTMGMKAEAEQFAARGRRIMEKRAAAIEDEAIRARYLGLPIAKTLFGHG